MYPPASPACVGTPRAAVAGAGGRDTDDGFAGLPAPARVAS